MSLCASVGTVGSGVTELRADVACATAYLAELTRRMRERLGDALLGVYAGGSYALGAYEPGRSDIDVTAVVAEPLAPAAKRALVAALRHEALPCPARGLELVALPARHRALRGRRAGLRPQPQHGRAAWTSASTRRPATSRASGSRSTARSCATTASRSHGPPAADLFAPIPRAALLPLLAESVRWHRDSDVPLVSDVVLNTARALHFAERGQWVSKPAAAAWLLETVANRLDQAGNDP